MKKTIYMVVIIALTLHLNSCKKSGSDDSSSTTPTPTPTNKLCDGNGQNKWIPMDSTNSWDYSFTIAGINQGHPTLTSGGTSMHGGKTYRVITDASSMMYIDDYEVREDAITHDIYKWNDNASAEYMEMAFTPTLNQTWSLSSNTRKITNLSASLTTGGCSYTGLLEMKEMDNGGATVYTYYYKKGLGLIKKQGSGGFGNIYTLTAVTLK